MAHFALLFKIKMWVCFETKNCLEMKNPNIFQKHSLPGFWVLGCEELSGIGNGENHFGEWKCMFLGECNSRLKNSPQLPAGAQAQSYSCSEPPCAELLRLVAMGSPLWVLLQPVVPEHVPLPQIHGTSRMQASSCCLPRGPLASQGRAWLAGVCRSRNTCKKQGPGSQRSPQERELQGEPSL